MAAVQASALRSRPARHRPVATEPPLNGDAARDGREPEGPAETLPTPPRAALVPLFPLDLVLFPGVALPLHIFEPRYRLMVKRCMATRTPFGVINISAGQLATIGTIADIREATRYVDGRWDLVTFGTRRFRVLRLDREAPYQRAEIELLDEPLGADDAELKQRADQVSNAFVAYLNLIRGADEVEIELESFDEEDDDDDDGASDSSDEVTLEAIDEALSEEEGPRLSEEVVYQIERLLLSSNAIWEADSLSGGGELEGDSEEDEEEHLLEAAITQLSGSDDPTALSHIIGGVVHLSTAERQSLLEAPDTASRLITLRRHLDRELLLLNQGFHPWSAPLSAMGDRRN